MQTDQVMVETKNEVKVEDRNGRKEIVMRENTIWT